MGENFICYLWAFWGNWAIWGLEYFRKFKKLRPKIIYSTSTVSESLVFNKYEKIQQRADTGTEICIWTIKWPKWLLKAHQKRFQWKGGCQKGNRKKQPKYASLHKIRLKISGRSYGAINPNLKMLLHIAFHCHQYVRRRPGGRYSSKCLQ